MKKIISRTIFVGLIAILFPLFFSYAQASNGSSKSLLITGNGTEPEQADPPWYDAAWNYRHPVTISYSGTTLPWYQVLVTLDSTNFNFSQAKADGSDVRFTHSDGTTDLKFWIESWVYGERAYIWVRVPNLTNGDTTIYLYYDNPNASTVSNGVATFDGFEDDWSLFTDGGLAFDGGGQISHHANEIESPFTWETIIGTPTASSGILSLTDGTGIESSSTYQNYAVGMRANFGLGSGREWGGVIDGSSGPQTMIGGIPLDPTNLYLINFRNNYENIILPREGGVDWHGAYHVYEVRWTSTKSMGDIDHGASTALSTKLTPNTPLPVTLYSNTGSAATLMVDWVYARHYR